MANTKTKTGRPTKYKPEYNELAIKFLSSGKSIIQLGKKIGVGRATLYAWADKHPEFQDTLKLGQEFSQAHWEDQLEGMMYSKDVNAPLVKLYFANRFGWSDKTEQEVKQKEKLQVEIVRAGTE